MRSSSLPSSNNSLLYIIIGVLGGILTTVSLGAVIAFIVKRKQTPKQNASHDSQRHQGSADMHSARASGHYDGQANLASLEKGMDKPLKKSNSQYSAPPPPQHPPATMSNGEIVAAAPAPSAPSNTYDVVPHLLPANTYDIVGLPSNNAYHVPGAKPPVANKAQINNQYEDTSAPFDPAASSIPTLTERARTQSELVAKHDAQRGLMADHYNNLGVLGTDTLARRSSGQVARGIHAVDPSSNIGYAQSTKN